MYAMNKYVGRISVLIIKMKSPRLVISNETFVKTDLY